MNSARRDGKAPRAPMAPAASALARMLIRALIALACAGAARADEIEYSVYYFKDNNESILSYVQAVNIWRYPVRDTWLLTTSNTDVGALGPPIIYAHNPNLPRFIHAALLGLGVFAARGRRHRVA